MCDHPEYRKLLLTLRESLKARDYTYRQLARELGVSEITVKRIFSGHPCSVERLFAICEKLGVSFFDVVSLAREEREVDHFLTPEQERFFAKRPASFAIFKELYRGEDTKGVARSWGLSVHEFYRVLRSLEKLKLLEVLPENRFRMRVSGNIRMSHRGPLARRVLRPQIEAFLDHVESRIEDDDICMHSAELELSIASIPEFVDEIHALGVKYRARAYRDKSLLPVKKLKSVRWLFAFAPYATDWHRYKLD